MNAASYDLVMMAASAGGITALRTVLSALPAGFPLPIAVVLHRTAREPHLLAQVLARGTALRVKRVDPGEALQPGTAYVAPASTHLVVRPDRTLAVTDGRKIRHLRSSANPLLESAAAGLQRRMIAVVLAGGGRDATDGVQTVKARGGTVIAQDEAAYEYFGMPGSAIGSGAAIETGAVDRILPLGAIGSALVELAAAGPPARHSTGLEPVWGGTPA
ncbi:MAG TPA: chemotaxis protein CheB [Gemmatimonadales bacterium]|nr:chemotaxis protein CheB [Gemmatimonadales bacterium]